MKKSVVLQKTLKLKNKKNCKHYDYNNFKNSVIKICETKFIGIELNGNICIDDLRILSGIFFKNSNDNLLSNLNPSTFIKYWLSNCIVD